MKLSIYATCILAIALYACSAGGDNPGLEYAPNMYHPVSYDTYSTITDPTMGSTVSTRSDGKGEYYSINSYLSNGTVTSLLPVTGTIKRRYYAANTAFVSKDLMVYNLHKDSIDLAARVLTNPLVLNDQVLEEGKVLYTSYCAACHGENGQGEGKVAAIYKGVPAYNKGRVALVSGGHIFHTITHGKGRMWPHGAQINPVDRWKIVHYVQTLQKQ
jgi:cytochrome c5